LSERINKQYNLKYTNNISYETLHIYNIGYVENKGNAFETISTIEL